MTVVLKTAENIFQIRELLKSAELVPEGLEKDNLTFFCAREDSGKIIGVVGVEIYGDACLLRSLAVEKSKRNQGIARSLIQQAFAFACSVKSYNAYLLTETIGDTMHRYGFKDLAREEAPKALLQSPFFNGMCPCSCQLMYKNIRVLEV